MNTKNVGKSVHFLGSFGAKTKTDETTHHSFEISEGEISDNIL